MEEQIDRVWDIVEKVGVCMLTTQSSDRLRARPVEARLKRDTGVIFVVTDIRSMKAEEIEAAPDVGLTFIDTAQNAYLSMTGRAGLTRDVAKIREAWRKTDEMWEGQPLHGQCFSVGPWGQTSTRHAVPLVQGGN
jgi:general stress protein 26